MDIFENDKGNKVINNPVQSITAIKNSVLYKFIL